MATGRGWRRQRRGATVVAASLILTGCFFGGDDDDASGDTTTTLAPGDDDEPIVTVAGLGEVTAGVNQLGLALSEGEAVEEATPRVDVVDGTPLSEAEVDALLARLPEWNVSDAATSGFERPAETLAPPPADTVEGVFPPDGDGGAPDEVDPGPLEVVRFQPEGRVDVAPFLTVTFNQPMVPLATLDQLDAADVPAQISPEVDGRWRWIGTRTLRFEVEPGQTDRLPASTEYSIEIPAGTRAAGGATLAETVTWSFSTPTVEVRQLANARESLPLDPVFVAVFDQVVDPAAVIETISIEAGGSLPVRLATDDELNGDPEARRTADGALDGRWVAFRAVDALPPDTAVSIVVGPNTPSAEGPLVTRSAETFSARTFGAFDVSEADCGFGGTCQPGDGFSIRFNNAIDPESYDADTITVSPNVPGLRIDVSGRGVQLRGATVGRTNYVVELSGELRDVFGQQLGSDRTFDWRVGAADPALIGPERQRFTIDPAAERATVAVRSINHESIEVTAWSVTPAELDAFEDYIDRQFADTEAEPPEWPLVLRETVPIEGADDTWVETPIDLTSAFAQGGSQLVVRIEPTREFSENDDQYWRNRPTTSWVQRTDLGIDALVDDTELVIWTTDLRTGEPVSGVPVELLGDGRIATTDEDGLATLDLGTNGIVGLWAAVGDRTAFMPADQGAGWQIRDRLDNTSWFVFDDRGIYRPGEAVRLTGWVRRNQVTTGDGPALPGAGSTIAYEATDAQGNPIASGDLPVNALGGFALRVELPDAANLGRARVDFWLDDPDGGDLGNVSTSHSFQVQEFRRPEFEVDARVVTPLPQLAADPATVSVDAAYFSGGPLPDAEVGWLVSTRSTTYRPPGWSEFSFGEDRPWWFASDGLEETADVAVDEPCFDCGFDEPQFEEYAGRTGSDGTHRLRIDFDHDTVDLPHTVNAAATVFDINRQAWSAGTSLLVHPAASYVGLRSDRPFVEEGTPIRVEAIVTDIDGAIEAGRSVTMTAGRIDWQYLGGVWSEVVVDESTCEFVSKWEADDPSMRCEFSTEVGGQYRVTAVVVDAAGDANRSELSVWVSGGRSRPSRAVEQETVTIIPDRETYEPGDIAELLVQAPWEAAHGLVTVSRHGIESVEPVELEGGSTVVEVTIEDGWYPNVNVQVDLVGSAERTDDDGTPRPDLPRRPAYATGQIGLRVPPLTRSLEVTATPADAELAPGDTTTVTVAVADAEGRAVSGADVAIVVVDEAVLSLTGYVLRDPLSTFHPTAWSRLRAQYLRSAILLDRTDLFGDEFAVGDSDDAVAEMAAEEAGDVAAPTARSAEGSPGSGIDVRSDFDALAFYTPDAKTGSDGTVSVDVPLPDNLTRYRVMAVAVSGADRFGVGESSITARLPLQLRPSPPRFLNFGDRAELPVVIENQGVEPFEVDLAIQVSNLALAGPSGVRVTVPAGNRVEVRFPVETVQVGTARARIVAASGEFTDAASLSMPVYTPATAEAFATYGVIDEGATAQTVLAPEDVFPQFGGLEISTSSTALQALTDAVLYLVDYRYESADGYASRIVAIAALRDVLEAFDADGLPAAAEIEARVEDDLRSLAALQNDDGGFPYWQRGRESRPWVSIQATHALVAARDAGYRVPEDTLARALDHLAIIEQYLAFDTPPRSRDALIAYSIYVRGIAGQTDRARARSLYDERGADLELDALAWIWPSIADPAVRDEIERRFVNSAVETAGAATFATGYTEDDFLIAHSRLKTDGIVLDALLTQTPESDLIPKVVAGLLGGQTQGRWRNAHENAFILLALDRYFATFEATTPAFVARAWLGDDYVAESEFVGRTTAQVSTVVPMELLVDEPVTADDAETEEPAPDDGTRSLVLAKDGDGRLYYRLGLRYAPVDLDLPARDEGFVVERRYEAVDDPADVGQDADGTWRIAAGATVRVRLTMVADARRANVALIDPLPAGLEAVNPALAISPTSPAADASTRPTWWWSWFEHQNLRDDRVEAYATFLPGGTYEYTYLARATTPGEFVVPPTRAEEIDAPEVFGRTSTDAVIID